MKPKKTRIKLVCCASCKWIFKAQECFICPKCEFSLAYGARWVFGDAAYTYQHTQEPWLTKKVTEFTLQCEREIQESQPDKRKQPKECNLKLKP